MLNWKNGIRRPKSSNRLLWSIRNVWRMQWTFGPYVCIKCECVHVMARCHVMKNPKQSSEKWVPFWKLSIHNGPLFLAGKTKNIRGKYKAIIFIATIILLRYSSVKKYICVWQKENGEVCVLYILHGSADFIFQNRKNKCVDFGSQKQKHSHLLDGMKWWKIVKYY